MEMVCLRHVEAYSPALGWFVPSTAVNFGSSRISCPSDFRIAATPPRSGSASKRPHVPATTDSRPIVVDGSGDS